MGLAVGAKVGDCVAGSTVEDAMVGDKVPLREVGFSLGRFIGSDVTIAAVGDDVGTFVTVRVVLTTLLSADPSTLEVEVVGLCLADKSPAQNPAPNTPTIQSAKKRNMLMRHTIENHSVLVDTLI